MKKYSFVTLFFVTLSLSACDAETTIDSKTRNGEVEPAEKMKLVCTEYDRGNDELLQRTFVLLQTDGVEVTDGISNTFDFELYEGANVFPKLTAVGKSAVEDVSFWFNSDEGSVQVSILLDEMNETSLSVNGKDLGDYVCR